MKPDKHLLNIYYATWNFEKDTGFVPYICIDYPPDPEKSTIVLAGDELIKDINDNIEIISYIKERERFIKSIITRYNFDYKLFNPKILNKIVFYDPYTMKPANISLPLKEKKDRKYLDSLIINISTECINEELKRAENILNNKVQNVFGRSSIILKTLAPSINDKRISVSYYPNGGCYKDTLKIRKTKSY